MPRKPDELKTLSTPPGSDYAGGYMDWDEEAESRVRSDEQIQGSVFGALSSEPMLDASQIDVQVIKGVVLLTGNVRDEDMKETAERRLRQIPGIRDIKNQLHLHPR